MATTAETARVPERGASLAGERVREALVGYGFILVPMGIFAAFYLYPIGYQVYISFHDWGIFGSQGSVGWKNYHDLFRDDVFGRAVKNTIYFTLAVVPAQMALGLFMALVVNSKIRGRTFFRSAFYFPSLTSSAAITAIAIFVLSADGLLNAILGTNRPWFGDPSTALRRRTRCCSPTPSRSARS